MLSVELPPNAKLDDTERKTDEIYAAIKDVPDVASIFILGGSSRAEISSCAAQA